MLDQLSTVVCVTYTCRARLEGHIGIMAVDGCGEVDSLSLSIFVVSKMAAVVVPRVPKYYIGCTNAPPIYSTPCVCVSAGAAHLDYATSVLFQTRALRSPSCATRAPLFFFFFFSLFNVAVDRVDRLVALFFFYFYYSPVFTTTKKASSSFQL